MRIRPSKWLFQHFVLLMWVQITFTVLLRHPPPRFKYECLSANIGFPFAFFTFQRRKKSYSYKKWNGCSLNILYFVGRGSHSLLGMYLEGPSIDGHGGGENLSQNHLPKLAIFHTLKLGCPGDGWMGRRKRRGFLWSTSVMSTSKPIPREAHTVGWHPPTILQGCK